ncbi:MAG: prephenate dehydrogenase/arogenate dehydrogenase family protein, partial [Aurantibacter sp.]
MNIFIIGIGLIGGSFAKDIKRLRPETKIYGVDNNPSHLDEAMALNIIDSKSSYDELDLADMIMVSIPVDVLVTELPKVLDAVGDDCVVFDG